MHVLYVLLSEVDGKLYIGVTDNLKRRLKEHQEGKSTSTRFRAPFKLVYCEAYRLRLDALERERKLKGFKNSYTELKKRIARSLECA